MKEEPPCGAELTQRSHTAPTLAPELASAAGNPHHATDAVGS